ncbi:hypothetical protein OAN24_00415 [Pseudodesulfovibrio sp.]|nr:hypothetical protein [Pseudodesulfovibrio sp.]
MPTDTAMEVFNAYKRKRDQNPAADQPTLFKYILWDRFSGSMVMDSDIDAMVTVSKSLSDLAFQVLAREKPAMAEGRLEQSARDAIKRYYSMNYPDGL